MEILIIAWFAFSSTVVVVDFFVPGGLSELGRRRYAKLHKKRKDI